MIALRAEKAVFEDQCIEIVRLREEKDKLKAELLTASEYILQLEEKTHTSNVNSLAILKQFKGAEIEIETLKTYINDLKAQMNMHYVPVKGDIIDQKLANFLNNFSDKSQLKVQFQREQPGIYEFGLQRVNLKVSGGKIVVRVGGGFLQIDEFIQ